MTTYQATFCGLPGAEAWWVSMRWPRSRTRYGGSCLLHRAESEADAKAIAAELDRRMNSTPEHPQLPQTC